jgi:hypothetical protein
MDMSRKWFDSKEDRMGNNREANKQFERAAREANLTPEERREFSEMLHDEKEFQTGDRSYEELLELAREIKR